MLEWIRSAMHYFLDTKDLYDLSIKHNKALEDHKKHIEALNQRVSNLEILVLRIVQPNTPYVAAPSKPLN